MKAVTLRHALFLAAILTVAELPGCADVHRIPAASTVVSAAPATQAANAPSPTNVAF